MLAQWELISRLVLAAALGSVVGWERERLQWAAGLRTHMLVSVGSCLMIIVSAYGFSSVLGRGYGRAMLAAYVHDVAFVRWPDERCCYIAHAVANERALACSTAAGFCEVREFEEGGVSMRLLVLERRH